MIGTTQEVDLYEFMTEDSTLPTIIVPARIASTRFPGKLLSMVNGKPLILWTAERISEVAPEFNLFFAVDGDETISSFSKKWRSTESQTNLGASLGFGVNFSQPTGNTLALGLGYDYLNVDNPIHSKEDFGGGYLFLKYHKR